MQQWAEMSLSFTSLKEEKKKCFLIFIERNFFNVISTRLQ